jgi:RNA 2',3'-cyclic 3'-phosphodiesterase
MAKKKRVFIGLLIPEKTKKVLVEIQEALKSDVSKEDVKWVEKENLHQTLVFLGHKNKDEIKEIKDIMEQIQNFEALKLELYRLEFHPDQRRARIVLISLSGEDEKLTSYYHQLRLPMQLADIEFDTRFSPHITLGRVRQVQGRSLFSDKTVNKIQDFFRERDKTFIIDKAVLFESELNQDGPTYKPLHQVSFKPRK